MIANRTVAVTCQLSRGGFSEDRVFRVQLAGDKTHTGVAPRRYCLTAQGQRLKPEQPAEGKRLSGRVEAVVVREEDDGVLLYFPDGSVAVVDRSLISKAPEESPEEVA